MSTQTQTHNVDNLVVVKVLICFERSSFWEGTGSILPFLLVTSITKTKFPPLRPHEWLSYALIQELPHFCGKWEWSRCREENRDVWITDSRLCYGAGGGGPIKILWTRDGAYFVYSVIVGIHIYGVGIMKHWLLWLPIRLILHLFCVITVTYNHKDINIVNDLGIAKMNI